MAFRTTFSWGRWLESELRNKPRGSPGRRLHVRYVCDLLAMCKPAGSDEPQRLASLANVSRGGVSLVVSEPYGKGAVLSLKAPLAWGSFLLCVVHVAVRSDGRRRLGCVLIDELTQEALRGFWNRETDEQRSCQRFLCEGRAWYRPVGARRQPRRRALVFDISALGAFLVSDQPVREESVVRLELRGRTGRPIRTLAYVVRSQVLNNKKWTCGCTFMRELAAPEVGALTARIRPEDSSS